MFRALLLLPLLNVSLAFAQSAPTLDSGQLVRVVTRGPVLRGRLLAPLRADERAMELCLSPGTPCTESVANRRVVPRAEVLLLERHARTRAPEGAVVGVVLGLLLGHGMHEFSESMCEAKGCAGPAAPVMIGSALLTGLFGAMIGTAFNKWEPQPGLLAR